MDRAAFEQLRDLPGKVISVDIQFAPERGLGGNLVFKNVVVENTLDWDVVLNGTYRPIVQGVTFNFVVRGVGPICRLDINGTIHGAAGRTHKHDLRDARDPYKNLPNAVPRPDLVGQTARQVWTQLCQQANIDHIGQFVDP
jgi:hypothetical protein